MFRFSVLHGVNRKMRFPCRILYRWRGWLLYLLSWPLVRLNWLRGRRHDRVSALDGLSVFLHEPRIRCRRILMQNQRHLLLLEARRDRLQSPTMIARRQQRLSWPGEAEWRAVIARDRRSRILAALHFGDYVHCLPRLALAEPPGRDRVLMRYETGSQTSFVNLREAYHQLGLAVPETLVASETAPLSLRQRLKRGGCTLTTFCDLSPEFGVPVETTFLGRRAWFCSGPAQLAVSAGVPVIPVHVRPLGQWAQVMLAPSIEPSLWHGLSYGEAVSLVTGRLVLQLERAVREMPECWRYLTVLPRYFTPPD